MTLPPLSTRIPPDIVPNFFEPLDYDDPASRFPALGHIIKVTVDKYPDDIAIIDEADASHTFKQVYHQVVQLANGLVHHGFARGDKVCICMPDRVEWPVAFLAALSIGVAVPADDWVPAETTRYILEHAGIKYIACLAGKCKELREAGVAGVTYIVIDEPVDGALSYADLVSATYTPAENEARVALMNQQKPGDMTFILYTSGTTGLPKGAMLTHANIAYNMSETARYLEMSRDNNDKVHCAPPFSHCFGNIFGILSAWYTGVPLAIMSKFDPKKAIEQISRLHLTITYGTPTQFRKMMPFLEDSAVYVNKTLRTGIMAGEPCPPKLIAKMMELGCDIRVIYGLTEASPGTNCTRATDPIEKKWTVGRAYRGSVVRIEDPIDGTPIPFGKEGEVVIYGPGVMMGYYNEPDKTAAITSDLGGLKTGDVGIMDEEGYLVISGRIKNIIIRGGNNLYPVLIESRMMQFLADTVEMVAIVGVKDEMYGEEVAAIIKTRSGVVMTPQSFVDSCYEQSKGDKPLLSREEVPRYVFIDTMDIPVSGRNKVLKNVLKKNVEDVIGRDRVPKLKPTALAA